MADKVECVNALVLSPSVEAVICKGYFHTFVIFIYMLDVIFFHFIMLAHCTIVQLCTILLVFHN
jgi:hypothetical protein